ncbi:hypothetical protein GOODEAATRI_003499, partial [Goodea atripinnis]
LHGHHTKSYHSPLCCPRAPRCSGLHFEGHPDASAMMASLEVEARSHMVFHPCLVLCPSEPEEENRVLLKLLKLLLH